MDEDMTHDYRHEPLTSTFKEGGVYNCPNFHHLYSVQMVAHRTHAVTAFTSIQDGKTDITLFWTLEDLFHPAPSSL